jgi:hypothetical protein
LREAEKLGRADDNQLIQEAVLALKGVADAPERALARLLRSDAELSGRLRAMIADALEGKRAQSL